MLFCMTSLFWHIKVSFITAVIIFFNICSLNGICHHTFKKSIIMEATWIKKASEVYKSIDYFLVINIAKSSKTYVILTYLYLQ